MYIITPVEHMGQRCVTILLAVLKLTPALVSRCSMAAASAGLAIRMGQVSSCRRGFSLPRVVDLVLRLCPRTGDLPKNIASLMGKVMMNQWMEPVGYIL